MEGFIQFKKIKTLDKSLKKMGRYFENLLSILDDMIEDLDRAIDEDYNMYRYAETLRNVIRDCRGYLGLPAYLGSELISSDVLELKMRVNRIGYWFEEMNNYNKDNPVTTDTITKGWIKEFKDVFDKCFFEISKVEVKK